ncbi:MAG: hypothetical protein M3Y75_09150 [Actinomycetota bacterium]|nr:hypothetical protein [Actinomycetota bacterium]
MRNDLFGEVEHVGFFLAECDVGDRQFHLADWIAIPSDGFEIQSSYHVSLTDETIGMILREATSADRSLIEVHSHIGSRGGVAFSPSDVKGLREWVPSMRWRLQGRPYGAMVWDEDSFDGLAWIEPGAVAEQVGELQISDGKLIKATSLTLEILREEGDDVPL